MKITEQKDVIKNAAFKRMHEIHVIGLSLKTVLLTIFQCSFAAPKAILPAGDAQ